MTSNAFNHPAMFVENSTWAVAARGAIFGFLAAITWIALGLESIIRPNQHNYRDLLWEVPFTLTMVAFYYMHALHRNRPSRAEGFSFFAVMAASALVLAGNIGVLISFPAVAALGFPWGAILWAVGLIVFGVGIWIAGVLPHYAAIALILLEAGSILTGLALAPISPLHERGSYSGAVEKGMVMAIVAWAMRFLSTHREMKENSIEIRPS